MVYVIEKPCPVCPHPERALIEDALGRGEPYRELKERFSVPIGAMRRHRRGNMHPASKSAPFKSEEVYLRFGKLPIGGRSYNWANGGYEDGVSVFRARTTERGYRFDIPRSTLFRELVVYLLFGMLEGHKVYLADGTDGELGSDGDTLLVGDVTLKPTSIFSQVELPAWLGREGEAFAAGWNRWKGSGCPAESAGGGRTRFGSRLLEREAVDVLMKMERTFPGQMAFSDLKDPEERLKSVRRLLGIDMIPDRGGTSAADRRLRKKGYVYTPDAVGAASYVA